ncbi:MAG TPA: peptidoglycan DD-metalloendopeptidase family protein [Segeticoccus sp.]|uniref:peptidoglycan DD-metalloendopeptidase family protein n=1 Tax=Segeticoccus sp. TaxID=2706531 RepID=UPI002D810224|nr:peptidoglycan DD-metalloendopeptidase family protein [Segeticoccus sp.]HET8599937.1 peptidoglycan DD-metalloendopeptidase family protein [Segeticoccus sp.]
MASAPSGVADPHDRKRAVDKHVTQLQGEVQDTSAALTKAYATLKHTKAQVAQAKKDLSRAQAKLADAQAYNQKVAAQLEVAQADEAKAEDQLSSTKAKARQTQDVVGAIARRSYQQGGMGDLDMALQALAGNEDLGDRMAMVGTVLRVQNDAVRRLAAQQAAATANEAHLSAVRHQVALLKAKAQAAVERAQQARDEADRAKRDLENLAAQQQQHAQEFEKQKRAELQRLEKAKAESARLQRKIEALAKAARERARREAARRAAQQRAARADQRSAPAPAAPAASGFLSYPVNAPITSEFGMRLHPILHIWRLHAGMDFGAACGTPVHAAASGTVVSAGPNIEAGRLVVIDNGWHRGTDLTTWYAHLSRIVKWGGHVNRGEVIGYVGNFGLSTGCHLHFETHNSGKPVNPRTWF